MTYSRRKERVGAIANTQQGRLAFGQLKWLGISTSTVQGWEAQGYLERVLPRVYAVGHTAPSREADLWAAVLYAGPGAALSHGTAAHWRGLIDYAPRTIEVSTPRSVRSIPGKIKVYGRRDVTRATSKHGLPTTLVAQIVLDVAATQSTRALNRALGQLDFAQTLDVRALEAACGHGKPGSQALRAALTAYQPRRKYANGPLEDAFLELCERRGLPLPVLNMYVHDIKADAYWPDEGLVVELDGEDNHSSPAQRRRDRRNDMTLRSHGLTVIRYDWDLVHEHPTEVCDDVITALERLVALRRAR